MGKDGGLRTGDGPIRRVEGAGSRAVPTDQWRASNMEEGGGALIKVDLGTTGHNTRRPSAISKSCACVCFSSDDIVWFWFFGWFQCDWQCYLLGYFVLGKRKLDSAIFAVRNFFHLFVISATRISSFVRRRGCVLKWIKRKFIITNLRRRASRRTNTFYQRLKVAFLQFTLVTQTTANRIRLMAAYSTASAEFHSKNANCGANFKNWPTKWLLPRMDGKFNFVFPMFVLTGKKILSQNFCCSCQANVSRRQSFRYRPGPESHVFHFIGICSNRQWRTVSVFFKWNISTWSAKKLSNFVD